MFYLQKDHIDYLVIKASLYGYADSMVKSGNAAISIMHSAKRA